MRMQRQDCGLAVESMTSIIQCLALVQARAPEAILATETSVCEAAAAAESDLKTGSMGQH